MSKSPKKGEGRGIKAYSDQGKPWIYGSRKKNKPGGATTNLGSIGFTYFCLYYDENMCNYIP